ncbi:MAG: hypothetical protein GY702_02510 [Desulfobulbaceae bacterium]|nr:hypothetical protein [Desulfobulbaceae bacterium]
MNIRIFFLIFIISFFSTSCSQDEATQKELVEIKQLLIEINQKLGDDQQKTTTTNTGAIDNYQANFGFREKGADIDELNKIILPENPSQKQVKDYIRKIGVVSAKQRSYSERDPQVYLLSQIGNENLELLLKANLNHQSKFYAIPAITDLVEAKDKDLILKYLPFNKDLVKVVIQNNWEKDAKLILYNELREVPHYLPTEWIRAITNLEESCIYDDLKQYLILGSNKSWTYETIKMLPDIELEDAIFEAWQNAKREKWSRTSFAPIALAHGHSDAFPIIIESLDSAPNDHDAVRHPRKHILQYTYARGSNDDLRNWYSENKDNLEFDKEKGKYISTK